MNKILFICAISWLFFGCATTENACDSVTCNDREQCVAGVCNLKEGYCNQKSDCHTDFYCSATFECVDEAAYCTSLECKEWQSCDVVNSVCILDEGRCDTKAECHEGEACGNDHKCSTVLVVTPCDDVDCGEHGSCQVVSDAATCSCDVGYHADGLSCMIDVVVDLCKDVSCDSWQGCNADTGECDLKVNRCEVKGDCNDEKICDLNHYCIHEDNPCEGQGCSGHGTCSVVEDHPVCTCDNGYINDGDITCIDPCFDVTCSGHGNCGVVDNKPICTCDDGYFNESDILSCVTPCDNMMCLFDSVCQADSEYNATCVCSDGYSDYQGQDGYDGTYCMQQHMDKNCDGDTCVIPKGWFLMGCEDRGNSYCKGDNEPIHPVYLDQYRIDQHEVTVEEYIDCVDVGYCDKPEFSGFESNYFRAYDDGDYDYMYHPVNGVTWIEAQVYCGFVGKQLPTEAQWEKAARGTDQREYPWGDDHNYCDYMKCSFHTYKTGGYPQNVSPYGVYDMAGNVKEWVQDNYEFDFYQSFNKNVNQINPLNNNGSNKRVMRGGFFDGSKYELVTYARDYESMSKGEKSFGFRCVSVK